MGGGIANLRSVKSGVWRDFGPPPKKKPNRFFFCYQLAQTPFCFVSVKSHFKNEGIFRFGPPISMDIMFSHFLVRVSFSVKGKKKRAQKAPKTQRRRRRRGVAAGAGGSGGGYGPKINDGIFEIFLRYTDTYF